MPNDDTILKIKDLTFDPRNARRHPARNIGMITASLREVGAARSVVLDENNVLLCGNGVVEAARQAGMTELQVIESDGESLVAVRRSGLTAQQKTALALYDNRAAELAEWDPAVLSSILADMPNLPVVEMWSEEEIAEILAGGIAPALSGGAGSGEGSDARPTLSERFGVPPFSVLDARQGYWQERKRAWLSLGIQSEIGRGETAGSSAGAAPGEDPTYRQIRGGTLGAIAGNQETLLSPDYRRSDPKNGLLGESEQARSHYKGGKASPGGSPRPAAILGKDGKTIRGDGAGKGLARCFGQDLMRGEHTVGENRLTWVAGDRTEEELDETSRKILSAQPQSGTSIFDPVLCELAYRWFCPEGGAILDPFAGGSVRGIVAAKLGRQYTGIDLRPEQIEANRQQAEAITPESPPLWIVGDSREAAKVAAGQYDLIFSCPPYGDLEVYSDNPADLSTLKHVEFIAQYRAIIAACTGMLKADRFACFCVGDFRDKKGFYRNFVSDTIRAFEDAGARLYNEAILVTAVGSLPIRVGRQFAAGRKLGKTHQNLLVFYKGDPARIRDNFGESCEFGIIEEAEPDGSDD